MYQSSLFTFLIVLSVTICNAQNPAWKIGLNYSMEYQPKIEFIPLVGISPEIPGINISSKSNHSKGISVERSLSNKFSLVGGINFANRDFYSTLVCHVCGVVPQTLKQFFIQLPISLKYYFLDGRLKPFSQIGFIQSFTLSNERMERNAQQNGEFILGVDVKILKSWYVSFSGGLQRNITSDLNYSTYKLGLGYSF